MPELPFPRWILYALMIAAALSLFPFACIARVRHVPSDIPRLHLIQDMDNQGRYKMQQRNSIFADGRAMRKQVQGTVARGGLREDDTYFRGLAANGEGFVTEIPIAVTEQVMHRGQRQFGIYCSPCHGLSGYGDGIVSVRAEELQQGTWVPPASIHAAPYSERPVGHYFNTITNGIRNMPPYGAIIGVEDRWAIVAYLKALQLSQNASMDDVPASERDSVRRAK